MCLRAEVYSAERLEVHSAGVWKCEVGVRAEVYNGLGLEVYSGQGLGVYSGQVDDLI